MAWSSPRRFQKHEPSRIRNRNGIATDLQQFLHARRMNMLDEWSGQSTGGCMPPGGNIGLDIRTICFMEEINIERADKWEAVFLKYYGVDYDLCAERSVRSSYKELLEVLNIATSVKAQAGWQIRARNPVRETILDKCAAIADAYVRKGLDDAFGLSPSGPALLRIPCYSIVVSLNLKAPPNVCISVFM